jgi:hypothetical protein
MLEVLDSQLPTAAGAGSDDDDDAADEGFSPRSMGSEEDEAADFKPPPSRRYTSLT